MRELPLKPVASILEIPPENIFANQLLFKSSGEFLGFDANEPTSRSGGKATAVQQIRKVSLIVICFMNGKNFLIKLSTIIFQVHGYKRLVMIGDGATDLEVSNNS